MVQYKDLSFHKILFNLQVLDMWLKDESSVDTITKEYGGILHYFAANNYAAGIEKLTREPYNLPPDEVNREGYSPFLMAANHQSLDAVAALLSCDVDIMMDPVQNKGNIIPPPQ